MSNTDDDDDLVGADDWDAFAAQELDSKLAAIAHPARRFILELLVYGSESPSSLAASVGDTFGVSTSRGSQHLQVLARAGLVSVNADGPRRDYQLAGDGFSEITEWLGGLTSARAAGR